MPSRNARGYAKGRARRHEILLVALNAFAEQGFRASSMREIADLVGLSRAGLLHHFSSKEEVLRLRDEQQTAFNERFGREGGLDAVRYLLDLNARQVELVGDRRCAGALPECVGFLVDARENGDPAAEQGDVLDRFTRPADRLDGAFIQGFAAGHGGEEQAASPLTGHRGAYYGAR
ncbi:TetR/AcrR family transcriptional regulator [Amycolatopsis panacis]|uniref:TetR/AcrR family transcriptional regulator n=1 Tax=Amycolatopsis panacis TaxID=2340917 RepID=A0A419I7I2_9PSEU|nr:helix-turn-helix domain-containing protein [Amycolatopsis panacis]RJQ87857.1 TetR/AcrR family transcriptional regulator [Amycolatopsis panacis]